MIDPPRGFVPRRQGDLLVLEHAYMTISYRERVQPSIAHRDVERFGATEWLVTHEGEHAALVTSGTTVLGFVFLDNYYAIAHGVADTAAHLTELARVVRELVLFDSHMLGIRRRAFRYEPPRGWGRELRGFETLYISPDTTAAITIQHAWPTGAPVELEGTPLTMPNGLVGSMLDLVRPDLQRTVVLLQDDRYLYPLRLDARDGSWPTALVELAHSVEPIPRPQRASSRVIAEALGYTVH